MSANGIRLHVVQAGDGPLVLLLHGFPEFWWSWRHQLVGLADAGYRAVAVDLRGYGESDKPPRGYDLWTLAGDAAGLVRALGAAKAVIVGHDWGGIIGWTVAALAPRVLAALAVLAAPHPLALRLAVRRNPRGQGRALGYALGFQLPRWPERQLTQGRGAHVETLLRSWSAPTWPRAPEFAEVAWRNREAMLVPGVAHCSLEYYRWAVRSLLRPDGRRFAHVVDRKVPVPLLQIHGAADPCLREPTARGSARWAGPDYRYQVLDGVGHFPHEEAPHATLRLLTDFLPATW